MKILVHQHLLTLRRGQLLEVVIAASTSASSNGLPAFSHSTRIVLTHHAASSASDVNGGPAGFQSRGRSSMRTSSARSLRWRAGPAALEQQRMALVVASQQPHGSVALPVLERIRLVLALAMRPLDLEDDVAGRDDVRDEAAGERLLELEVPLRRALLDQLGEALLPGRVYAGVGQRYASGRRWERDGSRRRTSSSQARSSSAEITVSSSGACASTVPHGSTISERP